MKKLNIKARLQSAHSKDLHAKIFQHSLSKFVVNANDATYRFHLNRYMVHAPEIYFRPLDRRVLEVSTNSVIESELIRETVDPEAGRWQSVSFDVNDRVVDGPVLCVSPWGNAFSNQIFHILMGIIHCDDILGDKLPVIVPDDLSDREISNLDFAGITKDRFFPVPRASACRVINAFIPSKSFVRSTRFGPELGKIDYGFIFEPMDLQAYISRIQAHPRVTKGPKYPMPRVVYLSRKEAAKRYTINEDEAVKALERFDVHCISPMTTPIEEIAHAIHNADIVISAFGAATLHFLAAKPGTTLIEFDHPANDQFARAICRTNGCKHIICSHIGDRQRDFSDTSDNPVDVDELVALVQSEMECRDAPSKSSIVASES
jgi:hypothetical protein